MVLNHMKLEPACSKEQIKIFYFKKNNLTFPYSLLGIRLMVFGIHHAKINMPMGAIAKWFIF